MPPVLAGALILAVPELGTALIGGVTGAAIISNIAFTGIMLGVQQLLAGGGKKTTKSEQVSSRDSNPQRLRGYGRAKLGGSTFFLHSVNGAILVRGWIHCEGPIDAYEVWYLNDIACAIPEAILGTAAGGTSGVAPWLGAVFMESKHGTVDQPVSGQIQTYSPDWTPDHQLKGLAYTVQVCTLPPKPDKSFQTVFPDGAPTPRVVARLSRVYDPRDGQTKWAQNPSLCIMDYITHERVDQVTGHSWRYISASRVDVASFIAFAEICDVLVAKADGSTEPRYRLDGVYDMNEQPSEVLKRMEMTCDAELYQTPDGKVAIRGGVWEEPAITITSDQIISVDYIQGNDKLSSFNRLKWTFTDQANDFQQVEGDPWDDTDAQLLSGEVLTESVDNPMLMSHSQGRRLAKIMTAKRNPRHHLMNCVVNMNALNLLGERMVRVQIDELELDEAFYIGNLKPSDDLSAVTLDLSSLASDAYDWNPALEEGTPPPSPIALPSDVAAPLAQNVTLSIIRQTVAPNIYSVQIEATATTNTSDNLSQYWTLVGQTRTSASGPDPSAPGYVPPGPWQDDMAPDGPDGVLSGLKSDGISYDVQVAYVGLGLQSAWSAPQTIKATSDLTPPSSPVGLVANDGGSSAFVAFTAPPSGNVHSCQIWRSAGASSVFSSAVKVGQPIILTANQAYDTRDGPPLAAGTYRYWCTALNGSNIASDPAGPATVTVS
jgi:hypothetical protein